MSDRCRLFTDNHAHTNKPISVAAGIVRWVRGEEFGIETLVMDGKAQAQLRNYIGKRTMAL